MATPDHDRFRSYLDREIAQTRARIAKQLRLKHGIDAVLNRVRTEVFRGPDLLVNPAANTVTGSAARKCPAASAAGRASAVRRLMAASELELTQHDVGTILGKDQATISRWLKSDLSTDLAVVHAE